MKQRTMNGIINRTVSYLQAEAHVAKAARKATPETAKRLRLALNQYIMEYIRTPNQEFVQEVEDDAPGPEYKCHCSYLLGPHTLECLNKNPNTSPPYKAKPVIPSSPAEVPEGKCQEASTRSREKYVPCMMPAIRVIQQPDGNLLRMCTICADHNTRNRGAVDVGPYLKPDDCPSCGDPAPEGEECSKCQARHQGELDDYQHDLAEALAPASSADPNETDTLEPVGFWVIYHNAEEVNRFQSLPIALEYLAGRIETAAEAHKAGFSLKHTNYPRAIWPGGERLTGKLATIKAVRDAAYDSAPAEEIEE